MKTHIIIFILFFCIFMSCNNSYKALKEDDNQITSWQTLIIESDNQIITIDKYEEYGVRDTCIFEEIRIDDSFVEYKPINRGQQYFDISQQEKDSLFKYICDIVTNPVYTEQFATCYVGNISIGFRVDNTTRICKYNSVGNWTSISPSMNKLYLLLNEKTKISEY